MKAVLSLFRIRFLNGLQYRVAALAGIATQFAWGVMEILLYKALYQSNPAAMPMELSALCSYVWMQQAFLALFATWVIESDLFSMVTSGNVAYELCRPMDLYANWFARSLSSRVSRAVLRCMPILLVAVFIPQPYGLSLPRDPARLLTFLVSMVLGCLTVVSFTMLLYVSAFFTINAQGTRIIITSVADLLSGSVLPLPFFPEPIRRIVELLPFAAMENSPLRIYSGDIAGTAALQTILLQAFWLTVMVIGGRLLMNRALKNVVAQGG